MVRFKHGFISDLHVGSLLFDYESLQLLLKLVDSKRIECEELHVVGDIVEGKLNHKGQYYDSFPIEIQESLAVSVIDLVAVSLKPKRVHILPGNHDRKYGINLLDNVVRELEKRVEKYKAVRYEIVYHRDEDYYVVNNPRTLVIHGLGRFKGSDYLGLTPQLLNNIYGLVHKYPVRFVVIGHYHRPVDLVYLGKRFILLPSFQYTEKPLRNIRGMMFLGTEWEPEITYNLWFEGSEKQRIIEFWKKKISF